MTGDLFTTEGSTYFLVSPSQCAVAMLGIPNESSKGRKKWLWVYGYDETYEKLRGMMASSEVFRAKLLSLGRLRERWTPWPQRWLGALCFMHLLKPNPRCADLGWIL